VWLKPKLVTQMEFSRMDRRRSAATFQIVGLREAKGPSKRVKALRRHPRRAHWIHDLGRTSSVAGSSISPCSR